MNDERFWSYVDKSGDCWLWNGPPSRNGYGQYAVAKKTWRAHRYAYQLVNGPIPQGMNVCHACDNRLCVNPAHLWLGTQQENIRDALKKGRLYKPYLEKPESIPRGSRHYAAKMNVTAAEEVRTRFIKGETMKEIAQSYGVVTATVWTIIHNKRWTD